MMEQKLLPETVRKSAGDLQAIFKQLSDVKDHIKEKNGQLRATPEYKDLQGLKKEKKLLEESIVTVSRSIVKDVTGIAPAGDDM